MDTIAVGQLDYARIQTDLIRMCEEVVACKNLPLVDGMNPKLAVAMATLLGWAYQQDEHLMASNEALAIKLGTLEQTLDFETGGVRCTESQDDSCIALCDAIFQSRYERWMGVEPDAAAWEVFTEWARQDTFWMWSAFNDAVEPAIDELIQPFIDAQATTAG